ncbi:hypothetical protein C3L29_016640 [Pseudomonas sp. MWU12-2534b]|nr:hypothetical protein C3L29_016640 [Pseudomonas sp. MWU12-2534b]
MQAKHHSSGLPKATTPPPQPDPAERHLMAVRIVGTAIFDYQVRKTSDARIRLETVASMAHSLGDITPIEAAIVARLLANDRDQSAPRASKRAN